MIVHCDSGLKGVVVDRGTGRRIPFVKWFDPETGEYERMEEAANGVDLACDEDYKVIRVRGQAVGRLELVPLEQAHQFGWREPAKVKETVKLSTDEKRNGLQQYKEVHVKVWQHRGESRRVVDERWAEYLRTSSFFDDLVLKRRLVRTAT